MKSNELRIGNLTERGKIEMISIGCVWIKRLAYFCDEIEPIPLTEEWLLKLGFEVYEFDGKENQYRYKDRLIVIRDNDFYDYGTSVKLNHIHQLQNLYFALTNNELIIR